MIGKARMPNRFWSGAFFFDPDQQKLLLHHRDGKTAFYPNKWAFFGGLSEPGETPIDCLRREMREELGIDVSEPAIVPLRVWRNPEVDTVRNSYVILTSASRNDLLLGEGAGFAWIALADVFDYDLNNPTIADLSYFIKCVHPQIMQHQIQAIG